MVFVILVAIIINRLFTLQIINGESYVTDLTDSIQKEMSVTATRGRIYDRNGVLLAYNELAYAVKISDSGTYTSKNGVKASDIKNMTVNNAIEKTLNIIEEKGDTYSTDFDISYVGDGNYEFNVSASAVLRFKRDVYGQTSVDKLSDDERAATANDMIDYLCNRYGASKEDYSPEHLLEILSLRLSMSANSYNRYLSFTIANEVSDETVAAILENSDELVGVTVDEQYVRRYVDGLYCSQIIGYTGTVSESELSDLLAQDDSYEANDVVGKTGIEQSMELELAGTKGSKQVYVDTVGRITEVIDETDASAGHDIYLTIDASLQKQIYEALEDELVSILVSNIVSSDTKYSYNSAGDISDIYIPIKEVYFALIDNNLVSLSKIADGDTSTAQSVYSEFLSKQASTMSWLSSEMLDGSTAYGKLTEQQQVYVWYVYELLLNDGVLDKNSIDTSNDIYTEWKDGNSVSLKELLTEGISQGWIDMTALTSQSYTSLSESYELLVEYVMNELQTDTSFYKKMYKYMIEDGQISGRELCMLLYEQGFLEDDGSYASLSSGSLSSYSFIINAISTKKITPGQLALQPCSASCVITDPTNGDVLALVSYPSYDNNKMSGTVDKAYYNQLSNDNSKPLLNWATQSQTAPGSTFKLCSALTGLDTGIISSGTTFNCSGVFTDVTPSPKCWRLAGHGSESVTTAIRDSCNVYFYNVGYKLACSKNGSYNSTYGTDILQHYAEEMGLATKAGIEIYEETPHASTVNAVTSAIGQGNHQYSCLNLARYVTTVATAGTCYNLTLIDKITDHEGNVLVDNQAEVNNTVNVSASTWNLVRTGAQLAGASYTALNSLNLKIAAKSGTAQERLTEPDHSLLISYAPYDNPEVAMSVVIPHGGESSTSMTLTAEIYKIYYGLKTQDSATAN
jgi:penicillin-binding protein 2